MFPFRISHFIGFIFHIVCFVTPVLFESNERMTELIQVFKGKGIIVIFGYIYFNSSIHLFICLLVCCRSVNLQSMLLEMFYDCHSILLRNSQKKFREFNCKPQTKSTKQWLQFVGLVWFVSCVFSDTINIIIIIIWV